MFIVIFILYFAATCCGTVTLHDQQPEGLVFGGADADIFDFPWQLSMRQSGSHICGASIISATWVVTAAHCSAGSPAVYSFRAGSSVLGSGGVVHAVAQKIIHPNYNSATVDYDLALFMVATDFVMGPGIAAVALPAQGQTTPAGSMGTITGWGNTATGAPPQLQAALYPVTSEATCQAAYGAVSARMICAGYPEGGVGYCQGDSGGPLVVDSELVGVFSWGRNCALPGFPDVFARVSSMRGWINAVSGV